MKENVYHFNTIGDIAFVKNCRSKSIRIIVKPNNVIKVTIPPYVSLTNAFRFVEEKSEWIRKSLEKVKPFEQQNQIIKPGFEFQTREHKMEFVQQPEGKLKARIGKGLIQIHYTTEQEVTNSEGQQFIRKAIEFAIRKEAKKYLPERIAFLSEKFGFSFSGLRLKNLTSRWGSCSSVNNINLNIHLVRLPDHLIDYVILHELIHTVHKNHGVHFWKSLDLVTTGSARLLANEMKKFRTQIY
jgi:predicted metal-dependent hydrolase